jgi:AcrR family transcriptional regulator
MKTDQATLTGEKIDKIPPKERILAAASDLFYRHGIRAVGVESIAEAAETNKMTLYRHFASKDELVAEYLRRSAREADCCWAELEREHPGDPLAQLRAWFGEMADHVASPDLRGCPLANAAVELPEKGHPARAVIEECKNAALARVVALSRAAGLSEPELLAEELNLLLEGARVTAQSVGHNGLGARLVRMGEAMIASHAPSG